MKLIRDLTHLTLNKNTVITIGNFDAIHIGHQKLFSHLTTYAKANNLASVVITFEPLPAEFFSNDPPARLCSFREKWLYLKKYNFDYVVCLRFNKKLAALIADDFVKKILVDKLHVKHIMVGEDFRFGHQRQGNVTLLKALGKRYDFSVGAIPIVFDQTERVSSTSIRDELAAGQLEQVHKHLNRPFTLSGRVSYGYQRGQQLGFPTANIHLRRKKVPLQGVYAVKIHGIDAQPHLGVANIGNRPTVHQNSRVLLEVHVFDFNQSLYGTHLTIEFVKKLRDEKRFDSLEALKQQIAEDAAAARALFQVKI